ncbi:MAG TPA: putative lipopolysaccharide heptosyltransferase III [Candidatus Baltobacteraceae bacterium]|nr:putative lipopolysaccharide heptosyltransferase III [Candidatus Baltobacteraceae bacterium]
MDQRFRPRRILCLKLKHIGDVLLMTAATRALRRVWPDAIIAAMVPHGTEGVLQGNPDLDQVLVFNRGTGSRGALASVRAARQFGPDLVLAMGDGDREAILARLSGAPQRVGFLPRHSGQWRRLLLTRAVVSDGRRHTVRRNLDLLEGIGIPVEEAAPVLIVREEARQQIRERLRSRGLAAGTPFVAVHPVSRWLFKAWPAASCAETLAHLARRGTAAVVTSGPEEKEQMAARAILAQADVPVIDLIGQTSLPELAAVLAEAKVFVGVDSAPMHMAAAVGTPVVALFGPSGEHHWGPWGPGHVVVSSPYLCRPCGRDGCLGTKRSDCLDAIPAARILEAVERFLPASAEAQ